MSTVLPRRHAECMVNGQRRSLVDVGDRLLIDFLRSDLGLTGTKLGCGTGDCGACTVRLDGQAVNACLVYATECVGRTVDTVEAIGREPTGAGVAAELVRNGAVQCGICTPGIVVTATCFLDDRREPEPPTVDAIERALEGNLCRCTGYLPIVRAIIAAGHRGSADTTAA